jgi:hypothetical protein
VAQDVGPVLKKKKRMSFTNESTPLMVWIPKLKNVVNVINLHQVQEDFLVTYPTKNNVPYLFILTNCWNQLF